MAKKVYLHEPSQDRAELPPTSFHWTPRSLWFIESPDAEIGSDWSMAIVQIQAITKFKGRGKKQLPKQKPSTVFASFQVF